ncbi:MAG: hypothetical protein NT106_14360, partial [Candidatus Sumerlaeota bacterium]|nr:hypothetical protein [Candidatus Sumerlaeota bacterium]
MVGSRQRNNFGVIFKTRNGKRIKTMSSCNPFHRKNALDATVLLTLAFLFIAPFGAIAQTAVAPMTGDGTSDNPYQIMELGNLVWMYDQAAGSSTATNGKYYKLMNNIDASETADWNDEVTTTDTLEGFNPIGASSSYAFKGVFLGQGYKITGLVINRKSTSGLFGYIGSGCTVSDLGLVGGSVTGSSKVGGLVGENDYGTVSNCYVTGSATGGSYVGGLVGENYGGTVSNCYVTGSAIGTSNFVGGLVGLNIYGTISNCYATSMVKGSSDYIGGLIGWNQGAVANCHATGAVTGKVEVGGLVGDSYGTISNCHATGTVTGDEDIGGLVGYFLNGTIYECYATGAVTGDSDVGGLVGKYNDGTIYECYAIGVVTGGSDVGGLVGNTIWGTVSNCYATGAVMGGIYVGSLVGYNVIGTISNCYATGAVMGSGSYIGGLVGDTYSIWATVTASYWNTETSGQASSSGGTGKTTAEMNLQSTYVNWDFTTIWGIGDSYPYLRALVTYNLIYTAGANGSIEGVSSQTVFTGASGMPVTAVPDPGYHFVQWSDGSIDNPRMDTNVTADISITASFAINQYTVTFQIDGTPGATIDGVTTQTISHGDDCTSVTANAPAGYSFVKWTLVGSDYSTDNPLTVTNVTGNITLVALFAINQYTVTFQTDGTPGATIDGVTTQTISHGND